MKPLSEPQRAEMQELWDALTSWAVFSDPPKHTRLRALFHKAFTPRVVERIRSDIEGIVEELITAIGDATEVELIEDFAYPLPAMVICDMLGMPRTDIGLIRDRSAELEPFLGLARKPAETYQAARESNHELTEYFAALVENHRRQPREDLLSQLIATSEAGETLSDGELIATCIMLQFAAHTTTTHLVGNGLLALLRNPDQEARLRNDYALIKGAVEEQLRYDGPIQALRRVVLEPIEFGGKRWQPGELVFLLINSANRDELRFADPDRFDVQRADNHHIAFGFGTHFCSGAALARIEGKIALEALLRRAPRIELVGTELEWIDSFGFRGLKALPLRFTV
jgi:cytochrome P450